MLEDEKPTLSKEFITLCQAQLNLLAYNFATQESAIYLTETDENEEPKLIPILVYPSPSTTVNHTENKFLPSLPPTVTNSEVDYSLEQSWETQAIINQPSNSESPHQLLLPLVYEDVIMGLLAANRWQKEWHPNEVLQVKKIAETITLARILDRKQQSNQQLLQRHQQLQILEDEHLQDFLHQLRNPLTALRTFAKLLLKRLVFNDPNLNITESIIREGDRIKDLIEDFSQDWEKINNNLDIILPQSKSTSFFLTESLKKLESTNLNDLVSPLVNGMKAIAKEKNIEIISLIDHNLPLVLTNGKALIEILNNLIENAIKYTPEQGKIKIEIKPIELTKETKIIIEISDTGYGIPEEDQQHIFERHYRGIQAKGDIKGTGLGLAIVKELCEQIKVEIELISPSLWLENTQFKGTTFNLYLPIFTNS